MRALKEGEDPRTPRVLRSHTIGPSTSDLLAPRSACQGDWTLTYFPASPVQMPCSLFLLLCHSPPQRCQNVVFELSVILMLTIVTEILKLLVVPAPRFLFTTVRGPDPCSKVQANHPKSNRTFVGIALVSFLLHSFIDFPHSAGKSVFFISFLFFFSTVDLQVSPSRLPVLSPSSLFLLPPAGSCSMTKVLQEYLWTRVSIVTL